MIILELSCGLGNQMFQYAMARQLQEVRNDKLVFNLYAFDHDPQRSYALYHFNLPQDIEILDKRKQKGYGLCCRLLTSILYRLHFMHGEKAFYRLAQKGFFATFDVFSCYQKYKCDKKDIYIKGMFQSSGYFEDIQEQLKKEFQILEPVQEKNQEILYRIRESNSVCVHIRRGDYITNEADNRHLNICSEKYYKEGMKRIADSVKNPIFFVFSNSHEDIEWIKANYTWEYMVEYVDQENCDYEELRLMMNCKHFIISNSTFSWWAQYLSDNVEKKVIAPSRWYDGSGQDASDIYMDSWEIVNVY